MDDEASETLLSYKEIGHMLKNVRSCKTRSSESELGVIREVSLETICNYLQLKSADEFVSDFGIEVCIRRRRFESAFARRIECPLGSAFKDSIGC